MRKNLEVPFIKERKKKKAWRGVGGTGDVHLGKTTYVEEFTLVGEKYLFSVYYF